MRWPAVMQAVVTALNADAALVAELGGQYVYPAQSSRPVRIPSVEWSMIGDAVGEVMERVIVQLDYWATSMPEAVTIEARIRAVLHNDVRRTFGGIDMATSYLDSRSHEHPEPGVVHRSLDFLFEPVRAGRQYHT